MKKIISLILVIAMCVGMLAACGGSSAPATTAAPAETTAAPAGTEAPVEQTGEGKTIEALFFSLEGEYFTSLDDMLRAGLEAKGYRYQAEKLEEKVIKEAPGAFMMTDLSGI